MNQKFMHRLEFISLEAMGGILLIVFSMLALVISNSPLYEFYDAFLNIPFKITFGTDEIGINKPIYLWINDGLMAIFFFSIGLEMKREFCVGALNSADGILLPSIGAIGGVLVPACIFYFYNHHSELFVQGWAIPVATDIAFALGMISLFGERVPSNIKVFLLTLAVLDDLGAIAIIALYHTQHLSALSLAFAAILMSILYYLNKKHYDKAPLYFFIGFFLWVAVLKSGVHATLAGVLLALFIPYEKKDGQPLIKGLEHDLHPLVVFCVLPAFAFANTGISMEHLDFEMITHPLTLGIMLGLFIGKQLGVFVFTLISSLFIRQRSLSLPLLQLYGTSVLCGIGFTMSLFIASLSFGHYPELLNECRLGVLLGTLLSATWGMIVLNYALPKK